MSMAARAATSFTSASATRTRLLPGFLEDLTIDLHGGGGGDVASVGLDNLAVTGPLSVSIDLGDGPDAMRLTSGGLHLGGPVRYDLRLGDGDDSVHFRQANRPSANLGVVIDLGAGHDKLRYSELADTRTQEPDRSAVHTFDIRGGRGNDDVEIVPCVVPGLDLTIQAFLGAGDDVFRFSAETEDLGAVPLEIQPCIGVEVDGGDGRDFIHIAPGDRPRRRPTRPEPLLLEDLTIDLRGGNGGDFAIVVLDNLAVTGPLAIAIDLGDGDDRADVRSVSTSGCGSLSAIVRGGRGDDVIAALNAADPGGPDSPLTSRSLVRRGTTCSSGVHGMTPSLAAMGMTPSTAAMGTTCSPARTGTT